MQFDGFNFRKSKTLGFRNPQAGECYIDGTPIPSSNCVFVKLADCPEVTKACWLSNGREYRIVSSEDCKKIPLRRHSLTNLASGPIKLDHDCYMATYHLYLAYDGKCYTSLQHSRELYFKIMKVAETEGKKVVEERYGLRV